MRDQEENSREKPSRSQLATDSPEERGNLAAEEEASGGYMSAERTSFTGFSEDDKSEDFDGHRPTLQEMTSTLSRASASRIRNRASSTSTATTTSSAPRPISRRESVLSSIRSRPISRFTHPLAHVATTEEQLVTFDGPHDPYHPINWPTHKKISTTLLYGLITMTATWASSSYSVGTELVAQEFGLGLQVATLGTTLFLFGFGLGPLLWAPLSEVYGRRAAVMAPMFVAICFTFGSATAKDFQALMLTRFFGAFFAAAPVTNTGGVLGDLFSPAWRGIAMAGYSLAVIGGPVIGKQ